MITWCPNYILLTSIFFSGHTCCHGNHTKKDFYKDLRRKQNFCHIWQIVIDIIIFKRLLDIYPGIIYAKFWEILPSIIWVIQIYLVLVDIHYFGNYTRESTENQQQSYIRSAYLQGILAFGGLFLIIKKKKTVQESLFDCFHNFQI